MSYNTNHHFFKAIKQALYQKDSRCFWCGTFTHLKAPSYKESNAPNFATLDHLFHANHPLRRANSIPKHCTQFVLACHACNNERSKFQTKQSGYWWNKTKPAFCTL